MGRGDAGADPPKIGGYSELVGETQRWSRYEPRLSACLVRLIKAPRPATGVGKTLFINFLAGRAIVSREKEDLEGSGELRTIIDVDNPIDGFKVPLLSPCCMYALGATGSGDWVPLGPAMLRVLFWFQELAGLVAVTKI